MNTTATNEPETPTATPKKVQVLHRGAASKVRSAITRVNRPVTAYDMEELTGIPAKNCGQALAYLESQGEIVRVRMGLYRRATESVENGPAETPIEQHKHTLPTPPAQVAPINADKGDVKSEAITILSMILDGEVVPVGLLSESMDWLTRTVDLIDKIRSSRR